MRMLLIGRLRYVLPAAILAGIYLVLNYQEIVHRGAILRARPGISRPGVCARYSRC
jgi:hypothetical protein